MFITVTKLKKYSGDKTYTKIATILNTDKIISIQAIKNNCEIELKTEFMQVEDSYDDMVEMLVLK
jgi:hypothetical protein